MQKRMLAPLTIGAVFGFLSAFSPAVSAAEMVDPSGTWKWKRNLDGEEAQSVLKLNYREGKLTGRYARGLFKAELKNGKLAGDQISFEFGGEYLGLKVQASFQGKVKAETIVGTVELAVGEQSGELDWDAQRSLDLEDVFGRWQFQIETENGRTFKPTLDLTAEGKAAKGLYVSPEFGQFEAKEIKIKGTDLVFQIGGEANGQAFTVSYTGKPRGDSMKGTLKIESDGQSTTFEFTGKRTAPEKK